MKKKVLCLALSLCLMFSLLPAFAMADGDVADGGDVSVKTLDLSENTPAVPTKYTAGDGFMLWTPTVSAGEVTGGELELNGASMKVISDRFALKLPANVVVNTVSESTLSNLYNRFGSVISLAGETTFRGSAPLTITGGYEGISSESEGGVPVYNPINMESGTLTVIAAVTAITAKTLTVSGGEIVANSDSYMYGTAFCNPSGTALSVTGGSFTSKCNSAFAIMTKGRAVFSGGTVDAQVPEKLSNRSPMAMGSYGDIVFENGMGDTLGTNVVSGEISGSSLSYFATTDSFDSTMKNTAAKISLAYIQPSDKPADSGDEFDDVADTDWYCDAVRDAVKNKIMEGVGNGSFGAKLNMTREMVWTVLGRLSGETISGADWAQKAKEWAVKAEISDGSSPEAAIDRQQLVTMLYRYAKSKGLVNDEGGATGMAGFEDVESIPDWAYDAFSWAVQSGLVEGANGLLSPGNNATRAEMAAVLTRLRAGK